MADIYNLSNGFRAVRFYNADSPVVHCALMIKCGGRDEVPGKSGMAHFIEHTLFKGTKNRSSKQIISLLEERGGELNAYTTKEETCLHASVMKRDLNRAADLIADIISNSVFPEKEIEKEKRVIADEIHSYEDTPYEQIYDDFENLLFGSHPMGNPILGKEEEIKKFKRTDLINFIRSNYDVKNIIWLVCGDVDKEEVLMSASYFDGIKAKGKLNRRKPAGRKPIHKVLKTPVSQFHFIMGRTSYSFKDSQRYTMMLLNNVLGGPGMNSRLNMNIREKYGYTYTIESGYHAFSDTGMFHIYFATDKQYFEKTQLLVYREMESLITEDLSKARLQKYKDQLCGQIMLAQESKLNVLLGMGRSALLTGKIPSLQDIINKINSITVDDFKRTAKEMLQPDKMSVLIYEPEE